MQLRLLKNTLTKWLIVTSITMPFATLSLTAFGAELCTYIAYTPAAIQQRIFNNLGSYKIAYLTQPEIFFADEEDMLEQIGDRDAVLLRANQIIASVDIKQDTLTGTTRITYYAADKTTVLLDLQETRSTCSVRGIRGVCNTTTIRTAVASRFEAPDFTISETPAGVDHYRFGQLQSPGAEVTLFAGAFRDSINWFYNYLQTPSTTLLLNPTTRLGAIYLNLASDSNFYPYLNQIRILEQNGTLVITGILPSSLQLTYLIQRLANMGYYQIRNQTILDSAVTPLPPYLPLTRPCL